MGALKYDIQIFYLYVLWVCCEHAMILFLLRPTASKRPWLHWWLVFSMFSLVTFSDNISHISKPALFNRWPNCLFVCSSFSKGPPLVKDLHIFNLQLQAICIRSNMFQWIGLVASTKTCQQEHCHACPRAPPHDDKVTKVSCGKWLSLPCDFWIGYSFDWKVFWNVPFHQLVKTHPRYSGCLPSPISPSPIVPH